MTTILLIRHGTTNWVDQHILHGITDIPLNENGLRQARQAAGALKDIHARSLYTSPLMRCVQTAEVIGGQLGLPPQPREGLKELNFGWLEGRKFRDHSSQNFSPLVKQIDHYTHYLIRLLTGESMASLRRRVSQEWERILAENPPGSTLVVVGHSAVFNTLLIRCFGSNFPDGNLYYSMQPGSISEIRLTTEGEAELVRLNDSAHLV